MAGTVVGVMGGMAGAATTVDAALPDAVTLGVATRDVVMLADAAMLEHVAVELRVVERSAVVADFMVVAVASTVAADTGKLSAA